MLTWRPVVPVGPGRNVRGKRSRLAFGNDPQIKQFPLLLIETLITDENSKVVRSGSKFARSLAANFI